MLAATEMNPNNHSQPGRQNQEQEQEAGAVGRSRTRKNKYFIVPAPANCSCFLVFLPLLPAPAPGSVIGGWFRTWGGHRHLEIPILNPNDYHKSPYYLSPDCISNYRRAAVLHGLM